MLTFLIPLRHPKSSKNWHNVCLRLEETLKSIDACLAQGNCSAILIANRGAELPAIPDGVRVLRVDLPPPETSVFKGEGDDQSRRRAVWLDKGSKIAAGAIEARKTGATYVMSVDADDLVSSALPAVVSAGFGQPGWYVNQGWLLPVGSRIGLLLDDFHNWCGTYAIVRLDLLPLADSVEAMDPEIIRSWFGHHRDLIPALQQLGHPLTPLPFPAAVYRIGHPDGNFQRCSLRTEAFSWSSFQRSPKRFVRRLTMLRPFLAKQERQYMGSAPGWPEVSSRQQLVAEGPRELPIKPGID